MLDMEGLLSGCDEFGTRIRIFTATLTGEREYKAHLGKFSYTGTTIPPDGELPSDVTQTEEVAEAAGVRGRLESGRVRHGYGEIKYESGSRYLGHWAFNKREGKGKFVYPCGDIYEGEWKGGKYHGQGKYTSGDSGGRALEYEGEWKADKMDGQGRYIYKDTGDVYEGNFVNGFREGFGKYTTKTGDVYMGEYEGGELQSKTKIDKASLQTGTDEWGKRIKFHTASLTGEQALESGLGNFMYTGDTIASKDAKLSTTERIAGAEGVGGHLASGRSRHGQGEIKYDSGAFYVGGWSRGKREGAGKFVFACGDVYEGQWKNGMFHGVGKYSSAESDEYEGEWVYDKMEGHGRYHYRASGDVYEGDWIGGVSHGIGKFIQASTGEVFMGVYASGELQSKTKIDKASLQTGTDEWGKRIKFHTASLTGEQAICAGLGNFMYTGDTIGSEAATAKSKESVVGAPGGRLQGTSRGRLASGRVRHGHGEIKYDSGSMYVGQWENDKRAGNGKYVFACGDVYEGQWKNGMFHGVGKYSSAESDEYEGEWVYDKMEGKGRYVSKETGDVYEGRFVKGVFDGHGKYTTKATGQTVEGEFVAGKLRGSGNARLSFIDSPFTTKAEYEDFLKLPEAEATARLALARAKASAAR